MFTEKNIVGTIGYSNIFPATVKLIADGRIKADGWVTKKVALIGDCCNLNCNSPILHHISVDSPGFMIITAASSIPMVKTLPIGSRARSISSLCSKRISPKSAVSPAK